MTPRTAAIYAREVGLQPPGRLEYDPMKWEKFKDSLDNEAEVLIIAFPEVLGDTLDEMVINLGLLATSGKMLVITDPSPSITIEVER